MFDALLLAGCVLTAGFAAWQAWARRQYNPAAELAQATDNEQTRWQDVREPSQLQRLAQALPVPVQPLALLASLGLMGLLISLLVLEWLPQHALLAAVAGAGSVVLVVLGLQDLLSLRTRRFEAQLLDAIDLMNAALQGGLPPRAALLAAADACKPNLSLELKDIARRLDLGLSLPQAVHRIRLRHDSEGVRLFSQAMIAKWHAGHDFADLLNAVSQLLRERIKLRRMVEGQLAGARYAALFSGALPYLLIPFFLWRQPEWLQSLLDHAQGPAIILTAFLLQLAGFVWLRRILRIEL